MKIPSGLLICILIGTGASATFSQTSETKTKPGDSPESTNTAKIRSRRTEQTPKPADAKPNVPADKKTESAKDPREQTAQPSESPNPPKPANEKTDVLPADSIAQLRSEIEAATTDSDRIRLRLQLAHELVNSGKKTEAVAELHSIANTDVFDPQGFYNAGNALARLSENEGAIQAYRKAVEQRKGRYSRALNNLGVVLLRTGRWDEAYEALLSALKIEGFRYPEASYNLGKLYAARGQNDLAVREWRRTLALDPKHTAAADALANTGNEGRITVESVKSSDSTTSSRSEKSTAQSSISNSASQRTLALDPVNFDLLQRARSDSEKGKSLSAIGYYRRLLARQGGYFAPANLELSFALISSQRYDEAITNLQMVATREGSRYPISYYHLARMYEVKGDLKQAEVSFSQAAAAFGRKNGQFLLDVSRVRERQGNFKGALEAMEAYLTIMSEQGQQPAWSDERLTALRAKVGKN